jgi:hypothetical protein
VDHHELSHRIAALKHRCTKSDPTTALPLRTSLTRSVMKFGSSLRHCCSPDAAAADKLAPTFLLCSTRLAAEGSPPSDAACCETVCCEAEFSVHDTTITAPKLTVSIFPNLKQQQMHNMSQLGGRQGPSDSDKQFIKLSVNAGGKKTCFGLSTFKPFGMSALPLLVEPILAAPLLQCQGFHLSFPKNGHVMRPHGAARQPYLACLMHAGCVHLCIEKKDRGAFKFGAHLNLQVEGHRWA